MGRGLVAPRFRWVPFDDALLFPLDTAALQSTPDRKFFYGREGLLVRWALRKYKRLRRHRRRAEHWLGGIARREPGMFAHWFLLGVRPAAG